MAGSVDRPLLMKFPSVFQADGLKARNMKYRQIISHLLQDLTQLEQGKALRVPLSELPDSKENVRSALYRVTRLRGMNVATSDDAGYLYVWKPAEEPGEASAVASARFAMAKAITKVTNSKEGSHSGGRVWIEPARKAASGERMVLPISSNTSFQEMKNIGAERNVKRQCGSQRGGEMLKDLA
jgi:hypothetical protein